MTLAGVLIVLFIILVTRGFGTFAEMIATVLSSMWQIIKMLVSVAIQFPNELGITDWISARLFFLTLTVLLGTIGITLTKKKEKKLLGIIVDAVAVVSIFLTFAA